MSTCSLLGDRTDTSLELRNRVYEYCADGEPLETFTGTQLFENFDCTFHLTQVCQQIRKEFRPFYFENTPIFLGQLYLIDKYLADFYPTAVPETMRDCRGNIMLLDPGFDFCDSFYALFVFLTMCSSVHVEHRTDTLRVPSATDLHSRAFFLNRLIDYTADPANTVWRSKIGELRDIKLDVQCDEESIIFYAEKTTVVAAKSWDIPDFPKLPGYHLKFTSQAQFGQGEGDWEW
jgi:hypothetical protein